MKTVLICDSDRESNELLSAYLKRTGVNVISFLDGESLLDGMESADPDLIMLEVILPNLTGIEICQKIREVSNVPIFFISTKADEYDRIIGLEVGGDDYIVKPFSVREITLKVLKYLDRISKSGKGRKITFSNLSLDKENMAIYVDGIKLDCTIQEYELIAYLAANPKKPLSREQLISSVWGYNFYGNTRSVDAAVKRLRKKFSELNAEFEINTVYGYGYRLDEKN